MGHLIGGHHVTITSIKTSGFTSETTRRRSTFGVTRRIRQLYKNEKEKHQQ